jgi:hypothetical protein
MFELAVQRYNDGRRVTTSVKLKFSVLAAGYGEHLFNQIARGIIGSDVAVFETSDLNANVMLEMGVALTWGSEYSQSRRRASRRLLPTSLGRLSE